MHLAALLGLVFAGVALLISGILSVWHDLMQRGPLDAPLIKDDGLNWSSRYRGMPVDESAQVNEFRATGRH